MAIAGIDVGSTGVKCSVYSLSGQAEAEAYREYASAREIAGAALDVFHQALDRYGKTDVTAVCATSFWRILSADGRGAHSPHRYALEHR